MKQKTAICTFTLTLSLTHLRQCFPLEVERREEVAQLFILLALIGCLFHLVLKPLLHKAVQGLGCQEGSGLDCL